MILNSLYTPADEKKNKNKQPSGVGVGSTGIVTRSYTTCTVKWATGVVETGVNSVDLDPDVDIVVILLVLVLYVNVETYCITHPI